MSHRGHIIYRDSAFYLNAASSSSPGFFCITSLPQHLPVPPYLRVPARWIVRADDTNNTNPGAGRCAKAPYSPDLQVPILVSTGTGLDSGGAISMPQALCAADSLRLTFPRHQCAYFCIREGKLNQKARLSNIDQICLIYVLDARLNTVVDLHCLGLSVARPISVLTFASVMYVHYTCLNSDQLTA